jgi:ribosomal protein L40E
MSDPDSNAPPSVPDAVPLPASKASRGILCVKCEHLNPLQLEACEICQAKLHINCRECGAKNPRVGSRCVQCQRRLHKPRRSSSGDGGSGLGGKTIGLIVASLVGAIGILLFLVRDSLPRLW